MHLFHLASGGVVVHGAAGYIGLATTCAGARWPCLVFGQMIAAVMPFIPRVFKEWP